MHYDADTFLLSCALGLEGIPYEAETLFKVPSNLHDFSQMVNYVLIMKINLEKLGKVSLLKEDRISDLFSHFPIYKTWYF